MGEPKVQLPDYKKIVSQIKKRKTELTKEEIARFQAEKERAERERLRQEILEKIVQNSQIEVPQALVELETERMLENLKRYILYSLQIDFVEYLRMINQTEKDAFSSLLVDAEKRVKNFLVLKKIEQEEKIESTQQELNTEMERIFSKYPGANSLDRGKLEEYVKEVIKQEKTFQLLESLIQES
jgi:trigger factor